MDVRVGIDEWSLDCWLVVTGGTAIGSAPVPFANSVWMSGSFAMVSGRQRRQARPVRAMADRTVSVDGRTFSVRIRGRGMPSRGSFGPPQADDIVWLLWSAPVWLYRRLTRRVDCTVVVYRLSARDWPPGGRLIHREHTATMEAAVARADRLVETLEDGTFPSKA